MSDDVQYLFYTDTYLLTWYILDTLEPYQTLKTQNLVFWTNVAFQKILKAAWHCIKRNIKGSSNIKEEHYFFFSLFEQRQQSSLTQTPFWEHNLMQCKWGLNPTSFKLTERLYHFITVALAQKHHVNRIKINQKYMRSTIDLSFGY